MSDTYPIHDSNIVKHMTIGELPAFLAASPMHLRKSSNDSFYGNGWNYSIDKLTSGDMSNVAAAEKILGQMSDAELFTIGQPLPVRSYWGSVPNIGAAIAGQPKTMYRRKRSENQAINTPISIYVDCIVSAGLSHNEIVNRGVAILALVMALNKIRPTSLYFVGIDNGVFKGSVVGMAVKMDTTPIDLGRATFALTSTEYARMVSFSALAAIKRASYSGCWGWYGDSHSEKYQNSARQLFSLEPHDLFLTGAHVSDGLSTSNPIAWVKAMLARHGAHID